MDPNEPTEWTDADDSDLTDIEGAESVARAANNNDQNTVGIQLQLIRARLAAMRQRHNQGP